MAKKIKVRLLDKVNSYRLGDTSYKPGDVFEIPSRLFRPDFFEKVLPPPPKPTPPSPAPEPEGATEEASEEALGPDESKEIEGKKGGAKK